MSRAESEWVACSPGDPTDAQWQSFWKLAEGANGHIPYWNGRTGEVRAETYGEKSDDFNFYIIQPDGKVIDDGAR